MEKRRTAGLILVWVLFAVYVVFIIYVSTAFLPPELPGGDADDDDDDDGIKPPPDNSTGGGGGTTGPGPQAKEPEEPPLPLRPVYYFRDRVPNFDFLSNVGLYVMFGVLAFLALATVPRFGWRSVLAIAVLLGIIMSIFLEIYQSSTSYRIGDPYDVMANVLGSFLGATALFLIFTNKDRFEREKEFKSGL